MAQLRDRHTSECVFTGTPLEVAALAEAVGFGEVIFDDVGEAFDPQAVLKAHREDAKGLDGVVGDTKIDADTRNAAKARAKSIRDEIDGAAKKKNTTTKTMQTAREARERAQAS